MRYIGVDLHKSSFTVCYLDNRAGDKLKTFSVSKKNLEKFKESLRVEDEVAVESTGNTGYFARELKGLVNL